METEVITQDYLDNSGDNTFGYVFWYNSFKQIWYAIPRSSYTDFFAGDKNVEGILTSNSINTLVSVINNPSLVSNTDEL